MRCSMLLLNTNVTKRTVACLHPFIPVCAGRKAADMVIIMKLTYFTEVIEGLEHTFVTDQKKEINMDEGINLWIGRARETQQKGGMLFFCGNGASATMAEHMSHDWFQNAKVNTYTCSETAHITAISNDISYAEVFAYRIERILTEKDILVTISSSGNSPNVIRAIEEARKKGAYVITVSGKDAGNQSRRLGDLNFYVPLGTYGLVESAHAVLLHSVLDQFLEQYMGGRH